MPPETVFLKKWQIALEEIDALLAEDLPPAPVVADAGYGDATEFREGLTERGFSYAVGIKKTTSVWPPGKQPLPPRSTGRGRLATLLRRDGEHRPVSVPPSGYCLPPTRSATQRFHPEGLPRYARNGITPCPSRRTASCMPVHSWQTSPIVPRVEPMVPVHVYDTVVLEGC